MTKFMTSAIINRSTGEVIENPSALFPGERADLDQFAPMTQDEWKAYVEALG